MGAFILGVILGISVCILVEVMASTNLILQ